MVACHNDTFDVHAGVFGMLKSPWTQGIVQPPSCLAKWRAICSIRGQTNMCRNSVASKWDSQGHALFFLFSAIAVIS